VSGHVSDYPPLSLAFVWRLAGSENGG
jgi:hypothetical protein